MAVGAKVSNAVRKNGGDEFPPSNRTLMLIVIGTALLASIRTTSGIHSERLAARIDGDQIHTTMWADVSINLKAAFQQIKARGQLATCPASTPGGARKRRLRNLLRDLALMDRAVRSIARVSLKGAVASGV